MGVRSSSFSNSSSSSSHHVMDELDRLSSACFKDTNSTADARAEKMAKVILERFVKFQPATQTSSTCPSVYNTIQDRPMRQTIFSILRKIHDVEVLFEKEPEEKKQALLKFSRTLSTYLSNLLNLFESKSFDYFDASQRENFKSLIKDTLNITAFCIPEIRKIGFPGHETFCKSFIDYVVSIDKFFSNEDEVIKAYKKLSFPMEKELKLRLLDIDSELDPTGLFYKGAFDDLESLTIHLNVGYIQSISRINDLLKEVEKEGIDDPCFDDLQVFANILQYKGATLYLYLRQKPYKNLYNLIKQDLSILDPEEYQRSFDEHVVEIAKSLQKMVIPAEHLEFHLNIIQEIERKYTLPQTKNLSLIVQQSVLENCERFSKHTQELIGERAQNIQKIQNESSFFDKYFDKKSRFIWIFDAYVLNMLQEPSKYKMDFLLKVFTYLNAYRISKKPEGFEEDKFEHLDKIHDVANSLLIKKEGKVVFSKSFNLAYFSKATDNTQDLDESHIEATKQILKKVLSLEETRTLFKAKFAQSLENLSDTQGKEGFLGQFQQMSKQYHQLFESNNYGAIILRPYIDHALESSLITSDETPKRPTKVGQKVVKKGSKKSVTPEVVASAPSKLSTGKKVVSKPFKSEFFTKENLYYSEEQQSAVEEREVYFLNKLYTSTRTIFTSEFRINSLKSCDQSRLLKKSKILFYDEVLSQMHNLLELYLELTPEDGHALLEKARSKYSLSQDDEKLLDFFQKERQFRFEPITNIGSILRLKNPESSTDVEKDFKEIEKLFYQLINKILQNKKVEKINLSKVTGLTLPDTTSIEERSEKFDQISGYMEQLFKSVLIIFDDEDPKSFEWRKQQKIKSDLRFKSALKGLNEIQRILNQPDIEMDYPFMNQSIYQLSRLVESFLIQTLNHQENLDSSSANDFGEYQHILWKKLTPTRQIFCSHNTTELLNLVHIDEGECIQDYHKQTIEKFNNFSNITYRYLDQADSAHGLHFVAPLMDLHRISSHKSTIESRFINSHLQKLFNVQSEEAIFEKIANIKKEQLEGLKALVLDTINALNEIAAKASIPR